MNAISKHKHIGKCKICGKSTILTFEHVPPRTTYNNHAIKTWEGEEITKIMTGKTGKFTINQRGSGGYLLCRKCNNNNGNWYVPGYDKIAKAIGHVILKNPEIKSGTLIEIKLTQCNPLAFLKEIVSMICCKIDHSLTEKLGFDSFLLNKEEVLKNIANFDILFYALSDKSMSHSTGVTMIGKKGDNEEMYSENILEIAFFPIGIILNLNPKIKIEYGISIKELFSIEYGDYDITVTLPYRETPYHPLFKMFSEQNTG